MSRSCIPSTLLVAVAALLAPSGLRAQTGAGVVSREVSVLNDIDPSLPVGAEVFSREVSIFNDLRPPPEAMRDAVSREVSIQNDPTRGEWSISDAVSRELSIAAPSPNLVPLEVRAPDAAFIGSTIEIRWSVENRGSASPRFAWIDRLRFSRDQTSTASDVLVDDPTITIRPFLPGEIYERSASLKLPFEAGEYFLILEVDPDGSVTEFDEADNLIVQPIRVILTPFADLTVESVDPLPDDILAGSAVTARWIVKNTSENITVAPSWFDAVFLVKTEELAAFLVNEPHFLGQFENPVFLNGGETYPGEAPISLPPDVEGSFRLAVYTDSRYRPPWPRGEVYDLPESDEENNWSFSPPFRIAARPLSDLRIHTLRHAGSAFSGEEFEITWIVENIGEAPTRFHLWDARAYLSTNREPSIDPVKDIRIEGVSTRRPGGEGSALLGPGASETRTFQGYLPPDVFTPAGEDGFVVKVFEDSGQIIEEENEANNVAVSEAGESLRVTLRLPVDLVPRDVEVAFPDMDTAGHPGHPVTVRWRDANEGVETPPRALRWRDEVYVSRDGVPSEDDRLLGRQVMTTGTDGSGRPVVEGGLIERAFSLPADLGAGTYFVIVKTDVLDEVWEGFPDPAPEDPLQGEANNVSEAVPIPVDALFTDLSIVIDPGGLARAGAAGQQIDLSWKVVNSGVLATPGTIWTDTVYLADTPDRSGPNSRVLSNSLHFGGLDVGDHYEANTIARLPALPPGEGYFLVFETDVHDRIPEGTTGEANNRVAAPFSISVDAPNLQIEIASCPDHGRGGEEISLVWQVVNRGVLPTQAPSWTEAVFLSRDDRLDPGDRRLASVVHSGPLVPAPGENSSREISGRFPLPVDAQGLYRLLLVADLEDDVAESVETDNVVVKPIWLEVEPGAHADLEWVSLAILTEQPVAGQTLRVEWTVVNRGDAPTEVDRWRDAFYLSRDRFLDVGVDVFLGARSRGLDAPPLFLEVGASYTDTAVFDLPGGIGEAYYLAGRIDSGGEVYEGLDETDNVEFSELFEVKLPPRADLTVSRVVPLADGQELPEVEAFPGGELEVAWDLSNAGPGTVSGRWRDALILSRDEELGPDDAPLGELPIGTVELEVGGTHRASATVLVPGVAPGLYRVLVRANTGRDIPELDEGNNLGVSAAMVRLDLPTLQPSLLEGPEETLHLPLSTGRDAFLALEIGETAAAGSRQTIRVTVEHPDPNAWSELYLAREFIPDRGRFDLRHAVPGLSSQDVVIPDALPGRYFVRAQALGPAGEDAAFTARILPYEVSAVTPAAIGDHGRATLTVRGSQFRPGSAVRLELREEDPDGRLLRTLAARGTELVNGLELRAQFELGGPPRGSYDVVVRRPDGEERRLPRAVNIEATVRAGLQILATDPAPLRERSAGGTIPLVVVNRGNVDAEYVQLFQIVQARPGTEREVTGSVASSDFVVSASIGGAFVESALVRCLPPGRVARLETTVRAGVSPGGELRVSRAVAAFSVPGYLELQLEAALRTRTTIIENPDTIAPDALDEVLRATGDEDRWIVFWFQELVRAGWIDPAEVDAFLDGELADPPLPATPCWEGGDTTDPIACADGIDAVCRNDVAVLATQLLTASDRFVVSAATADLFADSPIGLCDGRRFVVCSSCYSWQVLRSIDPNEKTGSKGKGEERRVPGDRRIQYRIDFENEPGAPGPASLVEIRDRLDPEVDPGSLLLERMNLGGADLSLPDGPSTYGARLDLTGSTGVFVDVSAGLDAITGEAFWVFQSRDPARNFLSPVSGAVGFLAVEDGSGRGKGWVEYSVLPRARPGGGSVRVKNRARITFDRNEPIETNEVVVLVDPQAPMSSVSPLPGEIPDDAVTIRWSGVDEEGGSGLESFTLFFSVDGGPFQPWLQGTVDTATLFPLAPGHSYAFYTLASDRAGNQEPPPDEPDLSFSVPHRDEDFLRGDASTDGVLDIADVISELGHLFLGDPAPSCADALDVNDDDSVDIADPLALLFHLFLGDFEIPPPHDLCGPDPTADGLHCDRHAGCEN